MACTVCGGKLEIKYEVTRGLNGVGVWGCPACKTRLKNEDLSCEKQLAALQAQLEAVSAIVFRDLGDNEPEESVFRVREIAKLLGEFNGSQ